MGLSLVSVDRVSGRLRSVLVVALVVGFVGLAAAGCSSGDKGDEAKRAKVACDDTGTVAGSLTVATGKDLLAPWFEDDPASGKGYESEIAYALAGVLGIGPDKVRWVDFPGDETTLAHRRFDLALDEFTPASLPAGTNATPPYYTSGLALVAPAGAPLATNPVAELPASHLGVVGDPVDTDDDRTPLGADEPTRLDDVAAAAEALRAGSVTGVLMELSAALRAVNGGDLPGTVVAGRLPAPQVPLVGAVPVGTELRGCLDRAVRRLQSDGTLRRLGEAYLTELSDIPTIAR